MLRSRKKNLLCFLKGACITSLSYAAIKIFGINEWYVKAPVIFFSDIGIGCIIVNFILFFTRLNHNAKIRYYSVDVLIEKYVNKARSCTSLFKGCNITANILIFAYMVYMCVMTSFDMFYIHIISFLIILFVTKNRASYTLEYILRLDAVYIARYYSEQSTKRKDQYIKLRRSSYRNCRNYSERLEIFGIREGMFGITYYEPQYICDFAYPDMLNEVDRVLDSYKKLNEYYVFYVETSKEKFVAEGILHKAACDILAVLCKMVNQEYNIIDVAQSKGIDDDNFKRILQITETVRNDVFYLMCEQRENVAVNFKGVFDEEINGYIQNHNTLFYSAGKCIFPIEVYYQRKTKLEADLIDLLKSEKREDK